LGFEPYLEQGAFKEGLNLVVTDCRRDAEIDWIVQQKEIIKSVNDAAQHLHEQKYRNRDLSETIVMEKHYYNVYLVYVKNEAAEKVDTDVLTHYCIGYAKGSRAIDITLVNDSTLNELNKKTDNLIKYFETTI
jgi:hypothetical protein